MKAIIGKKVGMSQIFDENGHVIPVTVIEAGPCVVVQKKTSEKEGYEAVQLGFEDISERKLTKPKKGHLDKAAWLPRSTCREFDLENAAELNVGDIVKADALPGGRLRGCHRHQQGPRLSGRHQAPRCPPPEGDPRLRPLWPSDRFSGRHQPHVQDHQGTTGAGHMGVER